MRSEHAGCRLHCDGIVCAAAEPQCRRAGVCLCQHLADGAAEAGDPSLPAAGRRTVPGAPAAGPQPGREGDSSRGSQVGER